MQSGSAFERRLLKLGFTMMPETEPSQHKSATPTPDEFRAEMASAIGAALQSMARRRGKREPLFCPFDVGTAEGAAAGTVAIDERGNLWSCDGKVAIKDIIESFIDVSFDISNDLTSKG